MSIVHSSCFYAFIDVEKDTIKVNQYENFNPKKENMLMNGLKGGVVLKVRVML